MESDAKEQNKAFLAELETIKQMDMSATETFLVQLFLVLRNFLRDKKIKNEKPLSELTLDDVLKMVKG